MTGYTEHPAGGWMCDDCGAMTITRRPARGYSDLYALAGLWALVSMPLVIAVPVLVALAGAAYVNGAVSR